MTVNADEIRRSARRLAGIADALYAEAAELGEFVDTAPEAWQGGAGAAAQGSVTGVLRRLRSQADMAVVASRALARYAEATESGTGLAASADAAGVARAAVQGLSALPGGDVVVFAPPVRPGPPSVPQPPGLLPHWVKLARDSDGRYDIVRPGEPPKAMPLTDDGSGAQPALR